MPKYGVDDNLEKHQIGTFGFTATKLADLESSGYTLATLVVDRSGSTEDFQLPMEATLKASVGALRRHPNSESMMLRVVLIDSERIEHHGFTPLADVDLTRYDGMLAPRKGLDMTSLFDGLIDAAEAEAKFGLELRRNRYNANGILIGITDGLNNAGKYFNDSDVEYVAKAFDEARSTECLESFVSILIGVNMTRQAVRDKLEQMHARAKFSHKMIDLKDATEETIARIGEFITSSVSSTSTALGTGGPNQTIKF